MTSLLMVRLLSTTAFGIFALAQVLAQYGTSAVEVGVDSSYAIREVAKARSERNQAVSSLIGSYLTARVLMALLAGGCMAALSFVLASQAFPTAALLGAALFVVSFSLFPDWALRGLERVPVLAVAQLVAAVAYVILAFLLVGNESDSSGALLAWAFGYLCGGLFLITALLKKRHVRLGGGIMRFLDWPARKRSLRFTLAGILGISLWQGLLLIVGVVLGPEEAGAFGAPLRVVLAIAGAGMVLPTAVYPVISSLAGSPLRFRSVASLFTRFMFLLGVPVALFGTLWAGELVHVLLGTRYAPSTPIFSLLIWSIPLSFSVFALEYVLLAQGLEHKRLMANVAAVAVAALLGSSLTVWAGSTGAAVAYLCSIAVLFASLYMSAYGSRALGWHCGKLTEAGVVVALPLALLLASKTADLGVMGVLVITLGYSVAVWRTSLITTPELAFLLTSLRAVIRTSRSAR